MDMSHLSFIIPAGADTPAFFWLTGYIGFPVVFLSTYFWWVLKEAAKEDRIRILKKAENNPSSGG
ncbi:cytochrome C oxidase subunit IV (plasmid) [Acidithiobacillus ferrianus]|uniref:Cytochrome C oxidase subunit IV n=2 Tax=Acidithiobacillus ferrianus TaxID=2678518 RepID=A0A845UD90_9PROT|nr:cytochrome C oxidase subunit IV [Acidithiobacillus ferrianus]AVK42807.1 CoxD [Acidithiobacillus sp.]NDU42580.1 cytochrome C oxidase subunit IV [Acidithiobacillus ferrianus]NDU43645.1 cytochrome C oxidase subunit IV [Acidithiobacillus ferrianus]